jgi:hypothetical protein
MIWKIKVVNLYLKAKKSLNELNSPILYCGLIVATAFAKPLVLPLRQSSYIGWINATAKSEQMAFQATGSV